MPAVYCGRPRVLLICENLFELTCIPKDMTVFGYRFYQCSKVKCRQALPVELLGRWWWRRVPPAGCSIAATVISITSSPMALWKASNRAGRARLRLPRSTATSPGASRRTGGGALSRLSAPPHARTEPKGRCPPDKHHPTNGRRGSFGCMQRRPALIRCCSYRPQGHLICLPAPPPVTPRRSPISVLSKSSGNDCWARGAMRRCVCAAIRSSRGGLRLT